MGKEFPGEHTPAGKPSVKSLQTPTSMSKPDIYSGHGKEYGQVTAKNPSGGGKSGGKKLVDICSGHGKEYAAVTSRG